MYSEAQKNMDTLLSMDGNDWKIVFNCVMRIPDELLLFFFSRLFITKICARNFEEVHYRL